MADSNRQITVKLMEDDQAPNEDEVVKTYKGKFAGYTLTELTPYSTTTAGNIDSAGDTTAELFINLNISATSGDSIYVSNGSIFDFQITVQ